ncbi:vWA domain-containing protein [Guggenheimella bovis]
MEKIIALLLALLLLAGCAPLQAKQQAPVSEHIMNSPIVDMATDSLALDTKEIMNTEEYNHVKESGFKLTKVNRYSTFAVDVDTASYANIRRQLKAGSLPIKDSVRIEEMLNYFRYDYSKGEKAGPFTVTKEYFPTPWNKDTKLLLIGIQANGPNPIVKKKANNFVFLIDVSGSMDTSNKLPLVKRSFLQLLENLNKEDTISIVTYASVDSVVIEGIKATETTRIMDAIENLTAGGSTAGSRGIETAYEIARKYYKKDGNNRVILATDGDLNVGPSSEGELVEIIEKEKKAGIQLSVLGFGTGNLKDNKLEALADHGDGNYGYIDSIQEARKVLLEEMGQNLEIIAKDVKLQMDFNPQFVRGYRLIGYENRLMDAEDFENDKKDGGEMGAGHRITVLYEIVDSESKYELPTVSTDPNLEIPPESNKLASLSIRYKEPTSEVSEGLRLDFEQDSFTTGMSENAKLSSALAEFGMLLRDSEYKGQSSYQSVLERLESIKEKDELVKELIELVQKAKQMD